MREINIPIFVFFIRGEEVRTQLLTECEEDQFRIAEYEKAEENREAAISSEQQ